MLKRKLTILHVEDDHPTARMVKTIFRGFGFLGEMLSVDSVHGAKELLADMEKNRKPLSLIISDMNLGDGTGLDIIREIRRSPIWGLTPIIVLSGETDKKIINSAYALGANCCMPKQSGAKSSMESLRELYGCWLETAWLPEAGPMSRLQAIVERAIELRTRTSEFYIGLARNSQDDPVEMGFWLNRALSEGNLSNLAAFFRHQLSQCEIPAAMLDNMEAMQDRVKDSLSQVEEGLRTARFPNRDLTYRLALELSDTFDESVLSEAFGCLFPISPVAIGALKARAAAQYQEIARHILNKTEEAEIRRRAGCLLELAQRLNAGDANEPPGRVQNPA